MSSITHKMELNRSPFDKIKSGEKTIELKLYDEKRKLIKIGDIIIFTSAEDNDQEIKVKVVELLKHQSFGKLIDELPIGCFGHKTKDAALESIYSIYPCEKELEYGVVGIKIALFES